MGFRLCVKQNQKPLNIDVGRTGVGGGGGGGAVERGTGPSSNFEDVCVRCGLIL